MIISFGAKNFFCFKEGVNVSLELGANCPHEISKGKRISNLLCIKGANGSGKTNLIKILSFLKVFCRDSWNQKPDEAIYVDSFFNSEKPIDIYCEFTKDGIQYLYETSLTKKTVISESLSRKKSRYTLVFRRENNSIVKCIKEFSELYNIKLRSNASIISTANQYEVSSIETIYNFFSSITSNVNWAGRYDFPADPDTLSEYYKNNPDVFKTAKTILKEADLGISDIEILSTKDEKEKDIYFPIFYHDAKVKRNFLTFRSQSSGTQTLFRIIPYYLYTLNNGGIFAMDEFDKDLHPHILPKILDVFEDESLNPNNAQLIFTAHNTEIIDILGKYRTFLVNKENSESYGYRLDEIQGELLRNDRPISPLYNKGKIGGIPVL